MEDELPKHNEDDIEVLRMRIDNLEIEVSWIVHFLKFFLGSISAVFVLGWFGLEGFYNGLSLVLLGGIFVYACISAWQDKFYRTEYLRRGLVP